MRKIAIVGFKGGIGKTTTCVNLGAALALRGHQVLLIDTDTQAALFKAQQRMVLEMAREEIFEELFANLNSYDYQLLDCAPSVSLLTVNAMAYVDEVFIPVSMEMLALAGAQQFMEYLRSVSHMLGKGAIIRLIIPTFYDPRRRVSGLVLDSLQKTFGERVTKPIHVDTRLSEAPGAGKTIFEYAPRSRGAVDYARLTEFVAEMPPLETNTKSK
jgi:chromosome partitioning protein